MRRNVVLIIGITLLCCLFLDWGVFSLHNLYGMRPFMVIALSVVLGIAIGGVRSGIICCACGLVFDIFFSKYIGLTAAAYLVCGMFSGLFFRRYYTDNVVFPALLALCLSLFCELFYTVFMAILGVEFNFFTVFFTNTLPCAVLTGIVAVLLHLILRPLLDQYGRFLSERRDRVI